MPEHSSTPVLTPLDDPFEMEKPRPADDVTEVARLVRQVMVLVEPAER